MPVVDLVDDCKCILRQHPDSSLLQSTLLHVFHQITDEEIDKLMNAVNPSEHAFDSY